MINDKANALSKWTRENIITEQISSFPFALFFIVGFLELNSCREGPVVGSLLLILFMLIFLFVMAQFVLVDDVVVWHVTVR